MELLGGKSQTGAQPNKELANRTSGKSSNIYGDFVPTILATLNLEETMFLDIQQVLADPIFFPPKQKIGWAVY